jgi:sec-independent protein translocase protein TatA
MGYEWLVVVGVLIVIFLWGPQKLPELARSIGQARKEFDKASKEVTSSVEKTITSTVGGSQEAGASTAPTASSENPLLIAAKSIGINTEGLTKEEITKKILGISAK